MKHIRSFLLTVALWVAIALSPVPATAQPYSVTFPPGFSAFANHLTPASIKDLIRPKLEMQIMFANPAASHGAVTYEVFLGDGNDWLDNATGLPATRIMATGEGAFIFNPNTSPMTESVPYSSLVLASSGIAQLTPTPLPGFHLRGRQDIGLGTFESTFGRNPRDFTFIHVYRFINNNYVLAGQFANGNTVSATNAKWFPSAPILEVGEAAFFELGPLVAGAPFPCRLSAGSAFEISGITTSQGDDLTSFPSSGAPSVYITGSGFNPLPNTDTVKLKSMLLNPATSLYDTFSATVTPMGRFLMKVDFNFGANSIGNSSAHYQGNYKIVANKNGGSAHQILHNVFHLKSATSPYRLTLTGPSLIKQGIPTTEDYFLCVENTSGISQPSVKVSVTVNSGPGSSMTATAYGTLTPSGSGSVQITTLTTTVPSLVANSSKCYSFKLTPNTSPLNKTVDLVATITPIPSTLPDVLDQVRLSVEVIP